MHTTAACSCWKGWRGRVLEHKGGWNRSGWLRAVIWTGAGFLRFEAEKRPLTKTEKETLPLHPLDGAGGLKRHQTKPRMELYRDGATLYKCTPTETADLSFPPHYTRAERHHFMAPLWISSPSELNWFGFCFLTICCNFNVQTEAEFFNQPWLCRVSLYCV